MTFPSLAGHENALPVRWTRTRKLHRSNPATSAVAAFKKVQFHQDTDAPRFQALKYDEHPWLSVHFEYRLAGKTPQALWYDDNQNVFQRGSPG